MTSRVSAAFLAVAILLYLPATSRSQLADSPWPKAGRDEGNTYRSLYPGPHTGTLLWSYADAGQDPLVSLDGVVITVDHNPPHYQPVYLKAINSDGSFYWSYRFQATLSDEPAIARGGLIYTFPYTDFTLSSHLCAINSTGTLNWSYFFPEGSIVNCPPAIGSEGTIYLIEGLGTWSRLSAFSPTGTRLWSYHYSGSTGGGIVPALGRGERIYLSNGAYAFNSNGSLYWEHYAGSEIDQPAAIGDDGNVFIPGRYYGLVKRNRAGALMWSYHPHAYDGFSYGSIESNPAVNPLGMVQVVWNMSNVASLTTGGDFLWSYHIDHYYDSTTAVGSEGMFYVGSQSTDDSEPFTSRGRLFALEPAGALSWSYMVGEGSWCRPGNVALATDGRLYVSNVMDGTLFCFQDPTPTITPTPTPTIMTAVLPPTSTPSDRYWRMFQHNPQRTGRCDRPGPRESYLAWQRGTGWRIDRSSPAVSSAGRVYAGSGDGRVYSLDENGTFRWSFLTDKDICSSPAVGRYGRIFVGSLDHAFYAITSDGTLSWSHNTGNQVWSSAAVDSEGRVYVTSYNNTLYAFNSTGSIWWSHISAFRLGRSSPALDSHGRIYLGTMDNFIYCLTPGSWSNRRFFTGGGIESSPAVLEDATHYQLYAGGNDNKIYSFYCGSGEIAWTYETGGDVKSSPAIAPDGSLYVGSCDNKLYSLSADGDLLWIYEAEDAIISSPAIDAEGVIYVGTNDNRVLALESTGDLLWDYSDMGQVTSSPAIGTNGRLFVGSLDNTLYCFSDPPPVSPPGGRSWWGKNPWTGMSSGFPQIGPKERPYDIQFRPAPLIPDPPQPDEYAMAFPQNFDPSMPCAVWIKFPSGNGSLEEIFHETFAHNFCDANQAIYVGVHRLGDDNRDYEVLYELMNQLSCLFEVRYFAFTGAYEGGRSALHCTTALPRDTIGAVVVSCPAVFSQEEPPGQNSIEQKIQQGALSDRPVFLMHGMEDGIVPIADSDLLSQGAPDHTWWRYHRVQGAGHEEFFHIPDNDGGSWGKVHPAVSSNPGLVWDEITQWEAAHPQIADTILPPAQGWTPPETTDEWYLPQDLVEWALGQQGIPTPTPSVQATNATPQPTITPTPTGPLPRTPTVTPKTTAVPTDAPTFPSPTGTATAGPMPGPIMINFQPPSARAPAGYGIDSGAPLYGEGDFSYGWR